MGRRIGLLLFVQFVGLTLPFILLMPITTTSFLENSVGIGFQIRVAVLLLLANGALTLGIAIAAFPIFREKQQMMALWLLAFSIIWFSLQAVDNAHILSMLSLSQQYSEGGASNAELFGALATTLRSTRRWIHYTELLVIDTWFFLFYGLLFRSSLIPRALAGFGVFTAILHATGIPLAVLLGYSMVPVMAYSLALSYVAVVTWLGIWGFDDGQGPYASAGTPS